MNKILGKILKGIERNNFYIKEYNTNNKILVVDRSLPQSVLSSLFCSQIINQEFKYNIKLISYLSEKNFIIKLYKSFGVKDFENLNLNFKKDILNFFFAIIIFFYHIPRILISSKDYFINKYKISDILIGDLIYDSFIRNKLRFKENMKYNLYFYKLIFLTIFKLIKLENLFRNNNFKCVISHTHVYASLSSLSIRLAIKNKIKVLMPIGGRIIVYKKSADYLKSELSITKNELKKICKERKFWKKELEIYLEIRRFGKIKGTTAYDAYNKTKKISSKIILKKLKYDKAKYSKVGLFATHCLSDANHAGGNFFFNDYYSHFVETVKLIKEDNRTLWIIKTHPTSSYYNEEDFIFKQLKKIDSKNIILCPKNIKPYQLLKLCEKIVTCRSTIAIEAAELGKKTIVCGKNFFTGFRITKDCFSYKEYKKNLLNNKTEKLNKKEILLAKKIFYFLAFKDSFHKSSIIPISNQLFVNFKDKKLKQNFFNRKKVFDIFSDNFLHKNLIKDDYFKFCKKKILSELR